MTSNSVCRFSSRFGLWTLVPRARAALFECMQSVRVLENITFYSLFTNRLRPFRDSNHHSNQQQPPPPLLIRTWHAALNSLSLSVLVMIFASFSDSFKYFHTADVFAALLRKSIWSRHVIVRYKLFGLFTYSAKHRKSFFLVFSAEQFRLLNIQCIPTVNLHPNCWSHPNFHEAAEGTPFPPALNHSTMLNQCKRWKISSVSSLYFSSVLGIENCEYIGSMINCSCSCKSFWMKESLDGTDHRF